MGNILKKLKREEVEKKDKPKHIVEEVEEAEEVAKFNEIKNPDTKKVKEEAKTPEAKPRSGLKKPIKVLKKSSISGPICTVKRPATKPPPPPQQKIKTISAETSTSNDYIRLKYCKSVRFGNDSIYFVQRRPLASIPEYQQLQLNQTEQPCASRSTANVEKRTRVASGNPQNTNKSCNCTRRRHAHVHCGHWKTIEYYIHNNFL